MKYLSVIRLFEYCNIDYSVLDIPKIKKIIAVEYSLSDKGIITIDAFDYTKDSVLQEIERDDFNQRIKFHITIWENKDLLNFLERDLINNNAFAWFGLIDSPEFKRFISPYFAYSFNKVMQKLLRDFNIAGASYLLKFLVLMNYADENEALTSTRASIVETLKLFKNTNRNNYRINYQKLTMWRQPSAFLFINSLPDSFSAETEDLVIALINLTVELQNKDKRLCFEISENLIRVNRIDPVNAETIRKNHLVFKSKISAGHTLWNIIRKGLFIFGASQLLIIVVVIISALINKCTGAENEKTIPDKTTPTSSYEMSNKEIKNKNPISEFLDKWIINKENKNISYNPYLYDITYKEFLCIRNKQSKILLDKAHILLYNEAIPLSGKNFYVVIQIK